MRAAVRSRRWALVGPVLLGCAVASPVRGQGTEPLRKTDVIRLLASPLIEKDEVAALIRRNCLSFAPTERDWDDFRRLGADPGILASIATCGGRRRASAGTTLEPLRAAPLPARVLVARPGAPARARIQPDVINLDSTGDVTVAVAVSDSLGHAVPGEPVELRADDIALGLAPATRLTDSLGHATFLLRPRAIARAGRLTVGVRGNALAWVDAAFTETAVEAQSGFAPDLPRVGRAHTALEAPLVYQVRGGSGRPLPGRTVVFAAVNAEVEPSRTFTDGAGLARVQVILGNRAGSAVVSAAVDSVQQQTTFRVTPGAATEVVLEQNNVRVDGGHLFVTADTTFVLRVSAKDAYGNVAPIGALARALEQAPRRFNAGSNLLRIVGVESDDWSTQVTFKAIGRGAAPLTLADATLTVEVVARGGTPR
jgi:hypothetical protein